MVNNVYEVKIEPIYTKSNFKKNSKHHEKRISV